jgi:hypothetical protein
MSKFFIDGKSLKPFVISLALHLSVGEKSLNAVPKLILQFTHALETKGREPE